ncbi:cysteine dioxygenase family protein [Aquibacillus koreensis]|uniref:Cysteine dioxygenase family protein n=2 Tax=Aquibacillus koreensis TaxID=279446 RepID=A0A9X4AKV8_9BACI|nr:cysteine dioxygenase family protein [Aquibacillus koreensis]MCT2534486.1 cysteine dioxygenase family protein [Aquibacillus koreensis]MDC3421793.1 cysteine dioxygenase family protein [Aquibacillus koreensis]
MELRREAQDVLDALHEPSKAELKEALTQLALTKDDFANLPKSTDGKPYFRQLVYQNEQVELLVMNWSGLACAPHDHGHSKGWIQVLSGTTLNSVYEVKENSLPTELFEEFHHKGKLFYAPTKGVHKIKSAGAENLLTLHLYSPPIRDMIVYDLDKCAACIVSDDCGAWWPEEQRQRLKEIRFKEDGSLSS